MGRIFLAFRVFFGTMFGSVPKDRAIGLLEAPQDSPQPKTKELPQPAAKPKPVRSEAITLLAALQREARLIDLIQEPLSDYSDDQIGAAARDVLRDTREALSRMIQLQSVIDAEDGDTVETPADFDAGCFKLSGNVSGDPPFKGTLAHHGWKAAKCEIPLWTGSDQAANVIAPAEIEVS
ncbi:MAG: DUF2760 domain-containing protein [Planctomycetales bacterium]|nr:DUF2760 domain-containing protein [Planctomycetales bacterium]